MSIGIWQLVFVPIALLMMFSIPLLATYLEDTNVRLGRPAFAIWLLAVILFNLVIATVGKPMIIGLLVVCGFLLSDFFQRAVVRRVRDTGQRKRLAYLAILPVLNLLIDVYLLLKQPGATIEPSRAA